MLYINCTLEIRIFDTIHLVSIKLNSNLLMLWRPLRNKFDIHDEVHHDEHNPKVKFVCFDPKDCAPDRNDLFSLFFI